MKVLFHVHEHPDAEDYLETMPTFRHEDNVVKRALNLKGGAGPCGVEGIMLRNWLLRHEIRSEKLRKKMDHWTKWLSNESPPYVTNLLWTKCMPPTCSRQMHRRATAGVERVIDASNVGMQQ